MKRNYLFTVEEQEQEEEKPPSNSPRPMRPWRVAVIANVKGETALPIDAPTDAGAEFDRKETIQAIQKAIESDGHTTQFLSADHTLLDTIREYCPDICFNISEGIMGDGREGHIPALLEILRIPYTASRVLANTVGLDKVMTKHIWRDQDLPTAPFQEFVTGFEKLNPDLTFPLFVKPAREGTGMGMDTKSIVNTLSELRERVLWVINSYQQPALVETFLPGREFTIGVLGRCDAAQWSPRPYLYGAEGFHRFPVLEMNSSQSITPGVYGHEAKTFLPGEEGAPKYFCPASVDEELAQEMFNLAVRAHNAIGAVDVSRVDIRLDAEGKPRLLEINTLPGLTPDFSDLCLTANAEGISYTDLILEILYLGASRWNLMVPPQEAMGIPIPSKKFMRPVQVLAQKTRPSRLSFNKQHLPR